MNRQQAGEAATMGARFLDTVRPDWWKKIDRAVLNEDSRLHCVVAQVEGAEFDLALERLGLQGATRRRLEAYGFYDESGLGYALLTDAWREQIELREAGLVSC